MDGRVLSLTPSIIGKGGEFITKIRSVSGSRISISKYSEADSNARTFTVTGPPESNQKALEMLFEALSLEKTRRLNEMEEEDHGDEQEE